MANSNKTIDFDRLIPFYIQLNEALEEFSLGEWKVGDQLPTEL